MQARSQSALPRSPAEPALDHLEARAGRDAAPRLGERVGSEPGEPYLTRGEDEDGPAARDHGLDGCGGGGADGRDDLDLSRRELAPEAVAVGQLAEQPRPGVDQVERARIDQQELLFHADGELVSAVEY